MTDSIIDKLQNYFGIAIRSNSGNLAEMKSNVLATLFHCASTYGRPLHSYCPALLSNIVGEATKGTKQTTPALTNMERDYLFM